MTRTIYREVSKLTGCFYEERRQILHSTGDVLRPDGTVAVGVYSSPAGVAGCAQSGPIPEADSRRIEPRTL